MDSMECKIGPMNCREDKIIFNNLFSNNSNIVPYQVDTHLEEQRYDTLLCDILILIKKPLYFCLSMGEIWLLYDTKDLFL